MHRHHRQHSLLSDCLHSFTAHHC